LRFLEDGEARLRARAAEALGKQGVARTVPALVAHLTDRDAAVRGETLLALARLCGRRNKEREALDPETESALLRGMTALVGDADPQVRWKAACAVAEIEIEGRSDALR